MTWIQRYRIRDYLKSSLWPIPLTAAVMAFLFHRMVWEFDLPTRWELFAFTPDGARAVVGAITSSGLTFLVFLLSMLFIAVQIAAAQLTPRITARVFEARASKMSLAFFIFTYVFSIGVGGKTCGAHSPVGGSAHRFFQPGEYRPIPLPCREIGKGASSHQRLHQNCE